MRRLTFVVGILFAAALATWAVLSRGGAPEAGLPGSAPAGLEPLAKPPRPPVVAEPPSPASPGLRGRRAPGDAPADRAALVAERNRLARAHADLIDRYAAGVVSQTEVERAELELLDARRAVGEIDEAELHRARIVLLGREAERSDLRVKAGMVPELDARRARLALDRERFLAGEVVDYAGEREAYLRALAEGGAARLAAGFTTEAALHAEREAAESDFPP